VGRGTDPRFQLPLSILPYLPSQPPEWQISTRFLLLL
jgi:hypothetical protein